MGVFFIRSVLKIITIILVLRKNRSQRNYCFHYSICHPPFCFVADWQQRRLETNGGNNRINFSRKSWSSSASGFTHYTGSKYSLDLEALQRKGLGVIRMGIQPSLGSRRVIDLRALLSPSSEGRGQIFEQRSRTCKVDLLLLQGFIKQEACAHTFLKWTLFLVSSDEVARVSETKNYW